MARFDLLTAQEIFHMLAVKGLPRNGPGICESQSWDDYKRAKKIVFRGIDVNPAKYREQIDAIREYAGRK